MKTKTLLAVLLALGLLGGWAAVGTGIGGSSDPVLLADDPCNPPPPPPGNGGGPGDNMPNELPA